MPRPNTFVIGAPKCGTSTIYSYLAPHPEVFMSAVKEPHYFAVGSAYRYIDNEPMYLELFADAKPGTKIIGEASTTNFHTPGAIENVHKFAPDAHIVAAVRNPIDLVPSLHGHLLYWQFEDVEDFEEAWRLWPERAIGQKLPTGIKKPDITQLSYGEMGLLGKHLKHIYEVFPREQVHILAMDDIRDDSVGTYRKLLSFLDLKDDGRTEFEKKNAARTHGKAKFITKLATNIPAPIRRIAHKFGLKNTGIVAGINSKFADWETKKQISPELRQELVDFYREDVGLLSELLGRDLSGWLKPKALEAK
ncbi:hypothetical protein BH11ARM2_BH11ARM2_02300 [soil metagenome]